MYKNVRLRQHRRHRNWRQSDVADQLGTTVTTIQRWERGIQQPSIYYRAKLCMLFGLSAPELGLEEVIIPHQSAFVGSTATEPSPAEDSEESALWTIPYARNPNFTGRNNLLTCLMQKFSHTSDHPIDTSQTARAKIQAIAIKGLGGIGKTQVAIEYAYRAREQNRYTHTIWINAASEETILSSFVTIVDLLSTFHSHDETDQQKIVSTSIRWLEQCTRPWLLIIDNADDLSLIQPYLPRLGNGHILFTTRASAVGALALSIEVDNMSMVEGTQFLLRRAQRLADASCPGEIKEARRLVETLGQFPLALDQAGAYIEESGCDFSAYLQLYQDHRQTLLARRGSVSTYYPHVITTTWCLSFQHIERINPAATHLLHLCAFLSPDHIPEELLTNGAEYWPPELYQVVIDPFAFNQLVQDLLTYSLVKRLARDQMLSLHRLVQVVQIDQMKVEEQRHWAERVVRAVHALFPHNPKDMETWPECLRYLEQAEACDSLIQRYHLLIPEAAEILDRVGIYHRAHDSYWIAEPLFQRALQIREQLVGSMKEATEVSIVELLYE